MPRLIFIEVYELAEVCVELAKRTQWPHKYSRERIRSLIRKYLPAVEKVGKRYLLTATEIEHLAANIKTNRRPKSIDKQP